MKILILPALLIFGILSSCTNKKEDNKAIPDKPSHGYNELADPDNRENITVSDYNTDNPQTENIDKPKTQVETDLDTTLLFQVWVIDADAPHAAFEISAKSFYIVDYDGDGDMSYTLNKRNLTYPDFEERGEILSVTKDKLIIKWHEIDMPTTYIRWKG